MPLTVTEAMMCGLPVVSTDMGAIPDLVEDGVNGYIVSSEDLIVETGGKFLDWTPSAEVAARISAGGIDKKGTMAFAERLQRLLTNADLREQMGRAGYERYQRMFTQEVFEKHIVECFQKCVK